jgi:hypothetical protein
MDALLLQGMIFSGIDISIVVILVWWLFISKVKKAPLPGTGISQRLAAVLGLLLVVSGIQFFIGAMWDTSMHLKTGEVPGGSDFLWPPHIMIYSGFLITLALGLFGVATIAIPAIRRGERDPRLWIRRSPFLGALAVASFYAIASIPGDAIWHELFGVDLTAWSPPHIFLGIATCATLFSGAGLLNRAFRDRKHPIWVTASLVVLFALILNIGYFIAAVEWETPGNRPPLVAARPEWMYPVIAGGWLFMGLFWAKRASSWRWMAVAVALLFFVLRLTGQTVIALTDNIPLRFPLLFIGGALLMDLLPAARFRSLIWRDLLLAWAFTLGYVLLIFPQIALRSDLGFSPATYGVAFGLGLVITSILVRLARFSADRMFSSE